VGECLSLNLHLTWGAVVDLSKFFFHLGLRPGAGRWIRIKTGMGDFQWKGPAIRSALLHLLDGTTGPSCGEDIAPPENSPDLVCVGILGDRQKAVSTDLEILFHSCNKGGLIVNKQKSLLLPSQQVNYLGQQINLRTRMVGPQPAKLSRGLEMTKSNLRGRKSSPAHITGGAGTLLDLQKGNVALHGLAKCIMREAAGSCMGEWAGGRTPCTL